MDKQTALYLAYGIAEALEDPESRARLLHLYGSHGVGKMVEGARALAAQYHFEPPLFPTAISVMAA